MISGVQRKALEELAVSVPTCSGGTTAKEPETGRPWRDLDSTTYLATIAEAGTFGTLLRNEARRRGLGLAQKVVYIGDGAEWVWRQAADKFPYAIQILDSYHAFEHLANLARFVKPDDWKPLLGGGNSSC